MEFIVHAPQPPKFDGHRAFLGKAQLSPYEEHALADIRRYELMITHDNGETIFSSGECAIRRTTVLRLLQLCHLATFDAGLIADTPQRLGVNVTR